MPPGVQHGHDNLSRRPLLGGVLADRNSASVVLHGNGIIKVDGYVDAIAETGERLVHGVVHDLVHHVVQAGAVIRVTDVHAWPLAHGLQALENLDALFVVFACCPVLLLTLGFIDVLRHDKKPRSYNYIAPGISGVKENLTDHHTDLRALQFSSADHVVNAARQRRQMVPFGDRDETLAGEGGHGLKQTPPSLLVQLACHIIQQQERGFS